MEKKRYIPVKGRKIYVEKDLFDEYNILGGGKMPSEALKFQRLPCCVRGKFRI